MDDIVRQFKGGIMRKSVGPGGSPSEFSSSSSSAANRNMTWETNEANDSPLKQPIFDMGNNNIVSDYEEGEKDNKTIVNNEEMESMGQVYGGYLDNEVNFKAGLSPKIVNKNDEQNKNLVLEKKNSSEVRSEVLTMAANFPSTSKEDPLGMPAEVNIHIF